MAFFKDNSIIKILSVAGVVTTSAFMASPSLALDYPSNSNHNQELISSDSKIEITFLENPEMLAQNSLPNSGSTKQGYPEPGTWSCVNNPNPVCKNPARAVGEIIPNTWICIGNPNPGCNNSPSFAISQSDRVPGSWICTSNPSEACIVRK